MRYKMRQAVKQVIKNTTAINKVKENNNFFFQGLFLEDLQYFIVTPHWMCTNIRRPLCFPSSLLLSEGTPRVPRPGIIEPRTYRMAGRRANH